MKVQKTLLTSAAAAALYTSCVGASSMPSFPALHLLDSNENDPEEEQPDIPATLDESAFESSLYHQLQEPYASYDCLPSNLHLSQASDIDPVTHLVSFTVTFTLDKKRCSLVVPKVLYGKPREAAKEATAQRTSFTYTSSLTSDFFESDWIYHVEMTDLEAGSIDYNYEIVVEPVQEEEEAALGVVMNKRSLRRGTKFVEGQTPQFSFFTPPLPLSPTTIALVGDLGQTVDSTKTMQNIYEDTQDPDHPVSLVMIVGDMSYADADPHRWLSWMELMEPLFRQTPLEVAVGNHEIECDKETLEVFVLYEHYFRNANRLRAAETQPIDPNYRKALHHGRCATPSQFTGVYNYGNAFYAFKHGMVQMIVLSSYSHTGVDSPQYAFLKRTLESIDRSVTPWVVVNFHCPFYTTFDGHINEEQSVSMRESMEPLFVQHGVNLVVSGHDHAYMRTYPMADGERNDDGPVYIIVGAGGNREGHSDYQHKHPEPWVDVRDKKEYGYGHFHAYNATHAHWHWIRDSNHKHGVKDHVWILNNHLNDDGDDRHQQQSLLTPQTQ